MAPIRTGQLGRYKWLAIRAPTIFNIGEDELEFDKKAGALPKVSPTPLYMLLPWS